MSDEFDRLLKALTVAEPSVEKAHSAFMQFGKSIEKHREEVQLKQQAVKKDSNRGSRLTKHRFSL